MQTSRPFLCIGRESGFRTASALLLAAFSPTAAAAQPTAPTVQTTREVVVDANREQLVGFARIVINPAGGFVIPQPEDGKLLFFDNTGKRIAATGRRGQGPGEFSQIGNMGWRGNTLWVADARDDRVTLFTSAGAFVRTIRIASGTESPPAFVTGRGDRAITTFEPVAMLGDSSFIGSARTSPSGSAWYMRITTDWKDAAIVTERPSRLIGATATVSGSPGGDYAFAVAQIPYLPEALTAVAANGDRIATAIIEMRGNDGVVKLKVVDTTGRAILEKSWPFSGVPVASGELEKVVQRIRARTNQSASIKRELENKVRDQFPRVYPPVTNMRLTRDGSTWIELGNHLTTRTWLRLDARGNPVHSIVLPGNSRFEEAEGNVIWASETDDVNLRGVVRYRIR